METPKFPQVFLRASGGWVFFITTQEYVHVFVCLLPRVVRAHAARKVFPRAELDTHVDWPADRKSVV